MSGPESRFRRLAAVGRWPLRVLLVAAVLVPAHQLTYLAGHGADRLATAMTTLGHDAYWPMVAVAAIGGLMLAIATGIAVMAVLRARLASLGGRLPAGAWPAYRARVLYAWPRLGVAALAAFVLQENLEHAVMHAGHVPGVMVLAGRAYWAALPVFALVSLLVASVASLLSLRVAQLSAAVAAAEHRRAWSREPRTLPRPQLWDMARPLRPLAIPDLGRAPPA